MSANIGAIPITTGHAPEHPSAPGDNYLTHGRGFMSWAFTLDHKRIGLLYMAFVVSAFALGGFFAVVLRTMLWHPADTTAPNAAASYTLYNNVFTIHGAVMVFLFIIPAIPAI